MLNKKISILCVLMSVTLCTISGCSGQTETIVGDTYSYQAPYAGSSIASSSSIPSSTSDIQSSQSQDSVSSTISESETSKTSEEAPSAVESTTENNNEISRTIEESSYNSQASAVVVIPSDEPEESSYIPEDISVDDEPSVENTAWKQAYINYINKNSKKINTNSDEHIEFYKLVNINNDDIPELYINNITLAGGDILCTYYNGTVIDQYMYNSGFSYIEGQNLFCDTGGRWDTGYHDIIYSLNNGKFISNDAGYYTIGDRFNVKYDENSNMIYSYQWNGNPVSSKSEYEELLRSVYDKDKAQSPAMNAEYNSESRRFEGDGICNYDEIIKAINNY